MSTVLPCTSLPFDALALRYGWPPSKCPINCACGKNFSIEHSLSCAKGGFPSIRHNEVRDTIGNWMSEVCNEVCIEPPLQPVTNETLRGASAIKEDGARLDIAANGFWGGRFERAYFDVRIFNPCTRPLKPLPTRNMNGKSSGLMRTTRKRGRAWIIHTTSNVRLRRLWKCSKCVLQEASVNAYRKMGPTLQQNTNLDEVQALIRSNQICHPKHPWGTLGR